MNIGTFLFMISAVLLSLSCGQATQHSPEMVIQNDTIKPSVDRKENERLMRFKENEEQTKLDSVKDSKVLAEALGIAEQYASQSQFQRSYVSAIQDSFYWAEVDIKAGFYFSDKFRHLIVRRSRPGIVYIDVFSSKGNQYQRVVSDRQSTMEYMGDTIRDINGDGLKDFVVNLYGKNGCCLKGFSDVFLQTGDKAAFSRNFQFINPTFSPREQVIRGVGYGHPGETAMYKYRWNKEAVDTVEYIYYDKDDAGEKTGRLVVSNDRYNYAKHLKRLSYIPAEYRRIEGYEWFIDSLGH